jgi:hypothetical protein
MKKATMLKKAILFLVLVLMTTPVSLLKGQGFFEFPPASPFNKRALTAPDSGWSYSFLAGGHLYGAHENNRSVYPAASFLGNIHRLNANPSLFLVATGDVIRSAANPAMIEAARSSFTGLNLPVFNAPGNHDLDDRAAYEKAFAIVPPNGLMDLPGSANQLGFFVRDDYFLILDSEYLLHKQASQILSFVARQADRLKKRAKPVRHLFVFSHRLLWALCSEKLAGAENLANEPLGDKVNKDSTCAVMDAVLALPHTGGNYWISGDVGTHFSVPVLYGYDESRNLHAIASGIGDTPNDALLKVTVNPEGKVSLGTLALTTTKWNPVETYTLEYWAKDDVEEGEDKKPVDAPVYENRFVEKVKAVLSGEVFWVALVMGLLLGLLVPRMLRRKKSGGT